jgi:Tfp pilus assembly protein PilF
MCRTISICLAVSCLLGGCASWRQFADRSSPTEEREARAAEAIRQFESHRDTAQYQAALDRCRQSDFHKAETLLSGLVARRPDYWEARLRLAEILSSRGDSTAESHYAAVLAANPDHAEAHHGLGVFLDSMNRAAEAEQHLQTAAELDPENAVYQTTLDSRAVSSP